MRHMLDQIAPSVEEQAALLLQTGRCYAERAKETGEVLFLRATVNPALYDYLNDNCAGDVDCKRWAITEGLGLDAGCVDIFVDKAETTGY